MLPKILISNLVYGEPYSSIFINLHLKSLLENCNPAPFSKDSIYIIYTDGKNVELIRSSINYGQLQKHFKIYFAVLNNELKYEQRYSIQTIQFQHSLKLAIEHNAAMHMACSDIYYGEGFWPNAIERFFGERLDAIFGHAVRTAYESIKDELLPGAVDNHRLFEISYSNLHPLWLCANWNSPMFSRLPYHIIWTAPDQIIVRGFSVSPYLFRPTNDIERAGGSIDISLANAFEKKHLESDWSNLPIIEIQQLRSFYPPFGLCAASVSGVANWAKSRILPKNWINFNYSQIIKAPGTPLRHNIIGQSEDIAAKISAELLK